MNFTQQLQEQVELVKVQDIQDLDSAMVLTDEDFELEAEILEDHLNLLASSTTSSTSSSCSSCK
jgi:hypothetical protein